MSTPPSSALRRRWVGALVFICAAAILLYRLLLGADHGERILGRAIESLAAALIAEAPPDDARWGEAMAGFSRAAGSALGAGLPALGLELTVRLRDRDAAGLSDAARVIVEPLSRGDLRGARDALIAYRDDAEARELDAATLASHARLFELVQRLAAHHPSPP